MSRCGLMTSVRCLFCLLLLVLWAPVAGAYVQPAAEPVLTVSGLGQPSEAIRGTWQFHKGDDPNGAGDDLAGDGWEPLSVDRTWGMQGFFAQDGFGWYRREIAIAPGPATPRTLWLYVPYVEDAYEVYWQGRLMGRVGGFPPHSWWSDSPRPHVFKLGPAGSGVLALRVWKAPLLSYDSGLGGGLAGSPRVGSEEAVQSLQRTWSDNQRPRLEMGAALGLLYALVMLASFAGWVQHREQPVLLWMALFALANVLTNNWWHNAADLSYKTAGAMASLLWQPLDDIATWFVLLYLLGLRRDGTVLRLLRWFLWAELLLCLGDGIAVLCWARGWPQVVDGVISEAILLPELFPVVVVVFALWRHKKLPASSWLVAVFALLSNLLQEGGAFLSQGQRFTHWHFWEYILRGPEVRGVGRVSPVQASILLLLLSLLLAVYRFARREFARERAMQSELRSAQELQRVLIPATLPALPGYEITSAYRPALDVGGDFFQLLPQRDGAALLVVGDVSGKGLAAAMAVSLIVGSLRTLAEQVTGPAEVLAGLNRSLVGRLSGGFATCVVVALATDGGLCFASAGHPGPFLNGREVELPAALPLGIAPDVEFEETCSTLTVGDHLTLFSDGLIEARNPESGALFGFDRVQALSAAGSRAGELADAAMRFGQEDDITVVTATRLRVGMRSSTSVNTTELGMRKVAAGLTAP